MNEAKGILLINKPRGKTSFNLVSSLRKLLGVRTIGHAGTLDPLATGVMILLVGRDYTRLSDRLLLQDKEYLATLQLGKTTTTYDAEGEVQEESSYVPSLLEIEEAIQGFQGVQQQIPPMFSAKKQGGKKLYELARKGQVVERRPATVQLNLSLVQYEYPFLRLHIACSKGTYVRSLAHDLGQKLRCGAYLSDLNRTGSGPFRIEQCIDGSRLSELPLLDCMAEHTVLMKRLGVVSRCD